MIIHDLDIERITLPPGKTDAVLSVDSNAMLAVPIAFQLFETQAWPNREIFKPRGRIEQHKLFKRELVKLDRQRLADRFEFLCAAISALPAFANDRIATEKNYII